MTYQVEIGIDGPRPEHLADIVNTVTTVYLEKAKSEEFYGRDDRLASLKEEQTRIQNETDSLLQEQDKIIARHRVLPPSTAKAPIISMRNSMQAE